MAGASLLTLLDDIAAVLDDVSIMTKAAAKKTAGVLGDDLALNAQQVTGVRTNRELPVVWAVAKGSALNKAILVPAALAISQWLPWLITPLMMIGGAFLCYEGVEKIAHKLFHKDEDKKEREAHVEAVANESVDLVSMEKTKIKGAIRTDLILSAEIIVLSLGVVADKPLLEKALVLIAIAAMMTVGVYGLVAGIVKMDDFGLWLKKKGGVSASIGQTILNIMPWFMKALSFVGTLAMFLVGGGIIVHSLPALEKMAASLTDVAMINAVVKMLVPLIVGLLVGTIVLLVVNAFKKLFKKSSAHAS